MMRERISMLFYQRLGWPAPREAFARLWVNGEYAGLYSMVEDINEEFLEHHFGAGQGRDCRAWLHLRIPTGGIATPSRTWTASLTTTKRSSSRKIKAYRSMAELFGPIDDMIRAVNDSRLATSRAGLARCWISAPR